MEVRQWACDLAKSLGSWEDAIGVTTGWSRSHAGLVAASPVTKPPNARAAALPPAMWAAHDNRTALGPDMPNESLQAGAARRWFVWRDGPSMILRADAVGAVSGDSWGPKGRVPTEGVDAVLTGITGKKQPVRGQTGLNSRAKAISGIKILRLGPERDTETPVRGQNGTPKLGFAEGIRTNNGVPTAPNGAFLPNVWSPKTF